MLYCVLCCGMQADQKGFGCYENKKRLMILGASYSQIPLMEAAKSMDVTVLAASIPGDYPGFAFADEDVYVDISDPDAVLEAARKADIDGIATCGLDLGMAAIGRVSEALRLPGPSAASARTASNKWEMKKALTRAGVQTARFFCIRNKEELAQALGQLPYPVILKAVDQMGSRGIFRCDTEEEVYRNYPRTMQATKKDYCLIEEFIEGEIFGVEGLVQNGEIIYLLPNNIEAYQSATPTPIGHSVPFRELDALGEQIRMQAEMAIRAVGLDNCPVNLDFIKKNGKVYVVELTGRSGATGLSEMVGIYYGLNYYEMIVRAALGMEVASFFPAGISGTPCLTHTLISRRTGVAAAICNYNVPDENTVEISFNIAPGDQVREYTNGRDRIGQVILKGDTLEQCEGRLQEILSNIRIQMEGDLPIYPTPIHMLSPRSGNQIYVKREDLLPFSFGGNKVRFAQAFLEDMERGGYRGMVIYGNYHSNLCRILSLACKIKGIPCNMVHNVEDADGCPDGANACLIRAAGVKEFPCKKENIAGTVQRAMDDLRRQGVKPYYIYGDCYGKGNEWVPMETYVGVYDEICRQEKEQGLCFDLIFVAASTGMTLSGLVAGHLLKKDERKIVGISVNRREARARQVIEENLQIYENKKGVSFKQALSEGYDITDQYLGEGYGITSNEVKGMVREAYETDGISFDGTYTGKAFYGMIKYLEEQNITGKKVLFLHTGGTPLFFEEVSELFVAEKMERDLC